MCLVQAALVATTAACSSGTATGQGGSGSDTSSADTGMTDAGADVEPGTDVPDTASSDTASSDTAIPDTAIPDTAIPDTAIPDTAIPDTASSDTAIPDTAIPDTAISDTGAADSETPDSDASGGAEDTVASDVEDTLDPSDTGGMDVLDVETPDTVALDAGPDDAGPADAGPTDAGPTDAGPIDAGTPDTGTPDTGTPDTGCEPDCDGKSCGDDGCGGSCGACAGSTGYKPAEICDSGGLSPTYQCEAPTLLNCFNAGQVDQVPFIHYGNSDGGNLSGNYSYTNGQCPGGPYSGGIGAAERIYYFTAPETGPYAFTLTPEFNAVLYVRSSCADSDSCAAAKSISDGQTGSIKGTMTAGDSVFIFVDGSSGSFANGDYKFSISETCIPSCSGQECGGDGCGGSCGSCSSPEKCVQGQCEAPDPAEICAAAPLVDTVPYSTEGYWYTQSTAVVSMSASCPGANNSGGWGSERIVRFKAPYTGEFHFELDLHSGSSTMALYVVTDCAKPGSTCLGGSSGFYNTVVLELDQGEEVIVLADRHSDTGELTGYDLSITGCVTDCAGVGCGLDSGCGNLCGSCSGSDICGVDGQCTATATGESCADPRHVTTFPYSISSSTVNANDDQSLDICLAKLNPGGGDGVGAGDHVYAITPTVSGQYKAALTFGKHFHAYTWLSHGCDDPIYQCADLFNPICSDNWPCAGDLSATMLAGETWYLVVDGDSSGDEGGYFLDITQECANECGDRVCGDDPCIGSCGTCPGGSACEAGYCVATDQLLINEVDYDQSGSDLAEFVEIVNAGQEPADLSAVVLESVNGDGGNVLESISLSALGTLAPGARIVVGGSTVEAMVADGAAYVAAPDGFLQNGGAKGDAARLLRNGQILDAVAWEAKVSSSGEGSGHAGTDSGDGSLSRCPDSTDTDDNAADFLLTANTTPGAPNDCP